MTTLPIPKYSIGDIVWRGRALQKEMTLPCPDCLGTRKWKIVTPGGSELEADCQRCTGSLHLRGVPSLKDHTFGVALERLTVGSIRVNTHHRDNEDSVQYMCQETGVGSGQVYNERMLHPTEEAARAEAQAEVAAKEAKRAATPERLEKVKFQYLRITDAATAAADEAVWRSWYRYRNLREDIEEELNRDKERSSLSEVREVLKDHLDWDKDQRSNEEDTVFETILEAAKMAASRWCDVPLREALERLPSLCEARRKAKAEDRG